MGDDSMLQYLRKQEKQRILTAVIIKTILAAIPSIMLVRALTLNFTNILIGCLIFAFTYDVCCIYEFSLRLTGNYIVAIFVSVAILGGLFWIYYMVISKLDWWDKQYSTVMEHILIMIIIFLLLIPFMHNIRSIIKA